MFFTNICLNFINCRYEVYLKPATILEPFVQENCKNDDFTFEGSFVVYNRSLSNFMQIGYFAPGTKALIQGKEPLKRKNFKIDIYFSLDNIQKNGDGFGFWISSPLHSGDLYGRNSNYTGFGVTICTTRNPHIEYIDSKGKRSKRMALKNLEGSQIITIIHQSPNVEIFYKSAKASKKELVYKTKSFIESNSVFGISGHTGQSETVMKIFSIVGNSIKGYNETFKVGQSEKSSFLVMFIGICGILGLVYYLSTKQKKYEQRMQ